MSLGRGLDALPRRGKPPEPQKEYLLYLGVTMEEEGVEEVISGHHPSPGWSGRDSFPSYIPSKWKQLRQQERRREAQQWPDASHKASEQQRSLDARSGNPS